MDEKLILIILFIGLISFASAHLSSQNYGTVIKDNKAVYEDPSTYIILTSSWILLITFFLLAFKPKKNKKLLFFLIAAPVFLSSLYLAGYTIYENIISVTGGPVHWHADYQIWACGKKLDLIEPGGITNKVGSPILHEHDDNRIHIEGTVKDWKEITLAEYFEVIGGELYQDHLIYQTDEKIYNYENNESCTEASVGNLKVFVNGKRIQDYENYLIYPNSRVPPGDCIIVIFDDTDSDSTNILCESWEVNGWNYQEYHRREINMGGKIWN